MTGIPPAAVAVIAAALEDARRLTEDNDQTAERISQYLESSGYQIAPDIEPAAA